MLFLTLVSFFFQLSAVHRDLHSFPTRRSSDLKSPGETDRQGALLEQGSRAHQVQRFLPLIRDDARRRWADQWKEADRKSTRLNSSHEWISYAVFCLKKKKN